LPCFSGLIISTTGFTSGMSKNQIFTFSEARASISTLIEQNGGTYTPDLTKNCTHLLTTVAEGRKFEFAQTWKVLTVHPDWLKDSVEMKSNIHGKYSLFSMCR
jgi:hypothetical protein